ncbi:MAG TPA: hypothetical protein VNN06_10495 [Ramlibacter sp.]|nr:hypothetical protein [Ramlibacter sp.]
MKAQFTPLQVLFPVGQMPFLVSDGLVGATGDASLAIKKIAVTPYPWPSTGWLLQIRDPRARFADAIAFHIVELGRPLHRLVAKSRGNKIDKVL